MGRELPIWVPPLAAVGLGVVLAATAHTSVWAPSRTGVADPVGLLTTVAISLAACAAGAVAVGRVLQQRRGRGARDLLPATVVAAVLVSLVAISRAELRPEAPPTGSVELDRDVGRPGVRLKSDWRGPAVAGPGLARAQRMEGPTFNGMRQFRRAVLILGALALLLALVMRRGAASPSGDEDEDAAEAARARAHDAILSTIEAMLADPDPRTAIIGAYARLQEELSDSGASRLEYEGPTEHLQRVLTVLDVRPGPLTRLIGLFEMARFSDHEPTTEHRDAALAALRAVASDLSPAGRTGGAVA